MRDFSVLGVDAGLRQRLGQLVGRRAASGSPWWRTTGRLRSRGTSRPKRLASVILSFSLISSSSTCWRGGAFCAGELHQFRALLDVERGDRIAVDDHDDLLRRRGTDRSRREHDEGRRQHEPAALDEEFGHLCHRCVRFLDDEGRFVRIRVSSHTSNWLTHVRCPCRGIAAVRPIVSRPRLRRSAHAGRGQRGVQPGGRLAGRVAAKRPQAELHHEGMVHVDAAAVGVICNVIQGQDEAVVDIADAELGLAELAGARMS